MNLRTVAAVVLAAIAILGVPTSIPFPSLPAVAVTVTEPSPEMKARVSSIAVAMRSASPVDRVLWASVWEKAAIIVSADAISPEVAFTDTRSLRQFTALALDIAWRRIGENKAGKYAGLREAVESALAETVGKEVIPVTPELRRAYADAARAIAWAGINGG